MDRLFRPVKNPDTGLIYRNLAPVSERDFHPSQKFAQINGQYVVSILPGRIVAPGQIGLYDDQRIWARIALTDDIRVEPFAPQKLPFLASVDVELGFRGKKTTAEQLDPDELTSITRRLYHEQILAPTQKLIMDYRGIPLSLSITTVTLMNFGGQEKASSSGALMDPNAKGLLFRDTEMNFFKASGSTINLKASMKRPAANAIVRPDFSFEGMGIGGLDEEFTVVFRRAFASRLVPAGIAQQLELQHVKGILLHGPPGTGKTLIARKIGQALNAKEPKVINGPEVLNKFVGQSEENIRKLFIDAEQDQKALGDESPLHTIIFDEIDAVCRQRGSSAGGTGVGDSIVNQLLSKLDGVNQLNNVLIIGMTNRIDMIDDALLRPGRLELHIEISLPDEAGRVQILGIHTRNLRKHDRLDADVDLHELAHRTNNFSGAEISGLIRAAQSFAFMRHTKDGNIAALSEDIESFKVKRSDFLQALNEVHSAFGVSEDVLESRVRGGIYRFSDTLEHLLDEARGLIDAFRVSKDDTLSTILFHGPSGSGKTTLVSDLALKSEYPMVRLVSSQDMLGMNESARVQFLTKTMADAHKSALCLLILDGIEGMIEWNPVGPRFSNPVMGALSAVLTTRPPKDRRLLILATTSRYTVLQSLDVMHTFEIEIAVPNVSNMKELGKVLQLAKADFDQQAALQSLQEITGGFVGVSIKAVIRAIRSSRGDASRFVEDMEARISKARVLV